MFIQILLFQKFYDVMFLNVYYSTVQVVPGTVSDVCRMASYIESSHSEEITSFCNSS